MKEFCHAAGKVARASLLYVMAMFITTAAIASDEDDVETVRTGLTEFAINAYSTADKGNNNYFFSPVSISLGLALLYGGARHNTETELAAVVGASPVRNDGSGEAAVALGQERYHKAFRTLRTRVNNSLIAGKITANTARVVVFQKGCPISDAFMTLAQNVYSSRVEHVDFAAAPEQAREWLNSLVSKETKGKIPEILPAKTIDEYTLLALLNAIYFKARWAYSFNANSTKPFKFWLSQERSVDVPTMYQRAEFAYGETDLLQIVRLPYRGNTVSMVIVLPKGHNLEKVELALTTKGLTEWLALLSPPGEYEVDTYIPRFEIDTQINLLPLLEKMGLKDIFNPAIADLTGIVTHTPPLYVTCALHQAGVKVDEQGTEAWAATAFGGGFLGAGPSEPPPCKVFRANHPFLFFIMDDSTGVILFMGRVVAP